MASATIALLGVMALALLLPRITELKLGKDLLSVSVGQQERIVERAKSEAEVRPDATSGEGDLQTAARERLISLERSRLKLASSLVQAAEAAAVPNAKLTSQLELATALKDKGKISDKSVNAIASLAQVFDQAWRTGATSPLVARDAALVVDTLAGSLAP